MKICHDQAGHVCDYPHLLKLGAKKIAQTVQSLANSNQHCCQLRKHYGFRQSMYTLECFECNQRVLSSFNLAFDSLSSKYLKVPPRMIS